MPSSFIIQGLALLFSLSPPAALCTPLLSPSIQGLTQHSSDNNSAASLPLPAKTIFQLADNETWFENIAVRPNGYLLITQLSPTPALYLLSNPSSPSPPAASVISTFPNATGLVGIAETRPDTFVLAALGDDTSPLAVIWEVDFSTATTAGVPTVRNITAIPDAELPNGVTSLGPGSDVVLVADSWLGLVWRVDTGTGNVSVAARDAASMGRNASDPTSVGINGVHVRGGGFLYYDNSWTRTVWRVALTADGYAVADAAAVEQVASLQAEPFLDDFTLLDDGSIWMCSDFGNSVLVVRPDGTVQTVVGSLGELTVAGDTAAAFGRTEADREILYVVTGGTVSQPVNGTMTEPAKVVVVDTSGYW